VEGERIKYSGCPLCESTDIQPCRTADCTVNDRWQEPLDRTITWVNCGRCGHIFTEGYYTDEALEIVFQRTYETQVVGFDIEANRYRSAKMVDKVVSRIGMPDGRMWLDVGFGNGTLLMTAYEYGFAPFGIDLRKQNVDELRELGCPAYHGTLESAIRDVDFEQKPAVISMADVLEHVPYPRELLEQARTLLDPGGILLISMPNADAPLWHYWNSIDDNPYWVEIEHYHNFTRERLYSLLETCGFTAVHYGLSERYRCCMEVLAQPIPVRSARGSVPTRAVGETTSTRRRLSRNATQAGKLSVHRGGRRVPPLVDRREAIRAQAALRQSGQLRRQFLSSKPRLPGGNHPVRQPDGQGFVGRDGAAGQDQVHRPAVPDQPR
jgi:SAM-dependent methyltransferase